MAHPQLGRQVLDAISNNLRNSATIERTPLIEGRTMTMILTPNAALKAAILAAAPAPVVEQAAPTPPAAPEPITEQAAPMPPAS